MKLLEAELTSIHREGENYRIRFTHKTNRQKILDFVTDEAPADLKFGTYTLSAEPKPEPPKS